MKTRLNKATNHPVMQINNFTPLIDDVFDLDVLILGLTAAPDSCLPHDVKMRVSCAVRAHAVQPWWTHLLRGGLCLQLTGQFHCSLLSAKNGKPQPKTLAATLAGIRCNAYTQSMCQRGALCHSLGRCSHKASVKEERSATRWAGVLA